MLVIYYDHAMSSEVSQLSPKGYNNKRLCHEPGKNGILSKDHIEYKMFVKES